MVMIARRNFLLGLASILSTPAIARINPLVEAFTGPTSFGILSDKLPCRYLKDIQVACMPTAEDWKSGLITEEPVTIKLMRGNYICWQIMINPRSSYRWVSLESGFFVPKEQIIRFEVEPAHTLTSIMLMSDIKEYDPRSRGRLFSECYKWRDGKCETESITALDPRDEEILHDE